MKVSASVSNSNSGHRVTVRTGAVTQSVAVTGKSDRKGSVINGGEFLMHAYRAAYVVWFEKAIYVLQCLQKKSPSGSGTAKTDMD